VTAPSSARPPAGAPAHEPAFTVERARSAEQFAEARDLIVEYAESLRFDTGSPPFRAEVDDLPWEYAEPAGAVLLARSPEGRAVGVVAVRPMADPAGAELRRLYVTPDARRAGVARALLTAAEEAARAAGYRSLNLVSLHEMRGAHALYAAQGFADTAPYRESTREDVLFMTKELG
jgi:GNAT superfamily N-acetyltransferase